MKKLLFLAPFIVLFISACSSESKENYTQMLGAFERNDTELNTMLNETAENINSEPNREKSLKSINENIIPRVADFRQTINNYKLNDEAHIEVQKAMVDYLNEVEGLMELYSNFNEAFFFVNPLDDDSIDSKANDALAEIKRREQDMRQAKDHVDKLIGEQDEK